MLYETTSYRQAISHCQQAYRRRDYLTARHWAEQATILEPDNENGWLWLAAVASPRASIAYLNLALEINPDSEQARKAMHWAIHRLRKEKIRQPVCTALRGEKLVASTIPSRNWIVQRSPINPISVTWTILLIALLLSLWGSAAPFVQSAFAENSTISLAQMFIEKPTHTYTPTPLPTSTPTATYTLTPHPTETPIPTNTPSAANDNGNQPPPIKVDNSEHWIDINLSEQIAYAYTGNELVNSFIVSTGTWQYPTVTGQFNIYVKYRYADMAGPGYYLPSVPYVMYFYEGYGLHGTYWHNNFGTPMSHGCVNFATEDAGWVFGFVEVGTLINIHY